MATSQRSHAHTVLEHDLSITTIATTVEIDYNYMIHQLQLLAALLSRQPGNLNFMLEPGNLNFILETGNLTFMLEPGNLNLDKSGGVNKVPLITHFFSPTSKNHCLSILPSNQ
jgi:hypothetical protein